MDKKMPRKIAVVTSTRADYGILRWLITDMMADPAIECSLLVTGSHLAPEMGMTLEAIEQDGLGIARKIETQMASDSKAGMAKSAGLAMLSFSDALADIAPDIMVVLGDRYEIAAISLTAFLLGIPVAHISGGEKTSGAIDDALRHMITKVSRFHFVATEAYRKRVIQLGEQPDTVLNVGDPGLDNFHRLPLLDRVETTRRLGFSVEQPFFLVTYHPATSEEADQEHVMAAMLEELDRCAEHHIVLTMPNTDAGSRRLALMAQKFAASRPGRVHLSASLGQLLYLSAMKHCAAVIGNSSSGIVEAPALKKPVVNIGRRQEGRLKAASIIDCEGTVEAIARAIERALSGSFNDSLHDMVSLYGDMDASRRIHAFLRDADLTGETIKDFHDIW